MACDREMSYEKETRKTNDNTKRNKQPKNDRREAQRKAHASESEKRRKR